MHPPAFDVEKRRADVELVKRTHEPTTSKRKIARTWHETGHGLPPSHSFDFGKITVQSLNPPDPTLIPALPHWLIWSHWAPPEP